MTDDTGCFIEIFMSTELLYIIINNLGIATI